MSDEPPVLPRFARDVRLTRPGPSAEAATGRVGPWTGVRRPFGGVLDPGVAAGEWPPAALSHLALGGILAEALAPRPGESTEPSPAPSGDDASADVPVEPTVRDVIREAGEAAAGEEETTLDPTAEAVRMAPREPVVDRASESSDDATPPDRSRPGGDSAGATPEPGDPTRRGPPAGEEVTSTAGESASGGDEGASATGEGPNLSDRRSMVAPRTVLRQSGGAPGVPTTLGERQITRVVEQEVSASLEGTGTGAGEPTSEGSRSASKAGESVTDSAEGRSWATPPVERTMPTVPAAFGAADGPAGPPTPDVARTGADSEGAARPGTAGGPSIDAGADEGSSGAGSWPALTVLEGAGDGGGAEGRRSSGGSASGVGSTAAGGRTGQAGSGPAGRGGGGGQSGADAAGAGSDAAHDLDALAGGDEVVFKRVVADAVSQPRVVERLFHELERRRRIERERGGRR